MGSAGYKVVTPGEDNLFDPEAGTADYEAAAVITDERIDGCVSSGGLFSDRGDIRGEASMKIDWQIYSRIKKQVVAHVSTSATVKLDHSVPGGVAAADRGILCRQCARIGRKRRFSCRHERPKALTPRVSCARPAKQDPSGRQPEGAARQIDDAVGSVVTILVGNGGGSGILVSDDGYILTNAHVVGDDKNVRVRWSDGIETLAEVVRVAKDRDVAIIKTNPRDRTPLALKRGAVTPGQRVYAIGSPLGKEFQGTVSSGVVSADRIFDGLRYIQSDNVVSPRIERRPAAG